MDHGPVGGTHHADTLHVLLTGTVVDGLVPGSIDTRRRAGVAAEGDEDGDQEEREGGREIRQGNDAWTDAATLGPAVGAEPRHVGIRVTPISHDEAGSLLLLRVGVNLLSRARLSTKSHGTFLDFRGGL